MRHVYCVYAGVFCLVIFSILGCSKTDTGNTETVVDQVRLKLTWHHGSQYLGFYVAQQQGFYADEQLDVTIIPREKTDDNIMEALAEGQYDFSVGSAVYRSQAEGTAVTAIAAIYQFGPDAFFAPADSGILTPADLAGRTVVIKSLGWERMLALLLEHVGLTLDDVKGVKGGQDMTPFFNRQVEVWAGYLTDEVIRARQHGMELVTLPLYEYGISTIAQTIATSQTLISSNPEKILRFLRASLRGWEWAIEHPSDAVDDMLKLFPDMVRERDFHLAAFDASIPLILPPGSKLGTIDCEVWRHHELIASRTSKEGLCTTQFLEQLWEGK